MRGSARNPPLLAVLNFVSRMAGASGGFGEWKDTEIGENGVLTLDAAAFAIGTVLTLTEPTEKPARIRLLAFKAITTISPLKRLSS